VRFLFLHECIGSTFMPAPDREYMETVIHSCERSGKNIQSSETDHNVDCHVLQQNSRRVKKVSEWKCAKNRTAVKGSKAVKYILKSTSFEKHRYNTRTAKASKKMHDRSSNTVKRSKFGHRGEFEQNVNKSQNEYFCSTNAVAIAKAVLLKNQVWSDLLTYRMNT